MSAASPQYSFGICGTTGPDPLYNPSFVLREPTAQAIVCLLNEQPRSCSELARLAPQRALSLQAAHQADAASPAGDAAPLPFAEAFERVVGLRAAVERDGVWHIGFPLLTAQDEAALRHNLQPIARDLADLLVASRQGIDSALEGVAWGRPLPEVRLAIVGCLALDWAALALLDAAGITHPGVEYPDGGRFTILGRERTSFSPPKLYCSSHTAEGDRYAFTGFGDNSGPRRGLPDVLWLLESAARRAAPDLPGETAQALAGLIRAQRASLLDAAGASLAAGAGQQLAEGEAEQLGKADGEAGEAVRELLEASGYLADGRQQILVIRLDQWPAIRQVIDETMKLAGPWILASRERIVGAAAQTSPARNGVDPAMLFVELWHDVFGAANAMMAEDSWLHDPAPPGPGQARYLTWCAEAAVYQQFNEWVRSAQGGWALPSLPTDETKAHGSHRPMKPAAKAHGSYRPTRLELMGPTDP